MTNNIYVNYLVINTDKFYFRKRDPKQFKMSKATRLLMLVALVLAILPCIFGGHLVHDFYKCSSDWYRSFFKRCKRNLNQYENDGEMTKSSLAMMLFSAVLYLLLWTVQKSMLQKTKLISGRVGHGIFWSVPVD